MKLMHQNRLELDILGEYPDRLIYTFITEELFDHEMDDLQLPGYTTNFCYEEFHPNHELDIKQRIIEFLIQWFAQKIDEYSWQLADPFVHPDTREFPKEDVLKKLNNVFASYNSFSNCEYAIKEINFQWDELKDQGEVMQKGS